MASRAHATHWPRISERHATTAIASNKKGDFVAKGIALPPVGQGDYIVMKDAGANTLSLFSRHCSRLCPAVWGYRWDPKRAGLAAMFELKPREALSSVSQFWGAAVPIAGL